METEGLSFPEAVERLAQETGVQLPRFEPREIEREQARAGIAEACEWAARFFEDNLRLSGSEQARAYIVKRGLKPETVKEFRIGFALRERDALKRYLIGKGVDEGVAIEAGLLIKPDDGRPSYDRFRNRLIIPIQDEKGRVVAFGGRALDPEDQPKYLNSPETPLFHKGAMLFNGHRARPAAHETGNAIIVEGYLDAIAVYQAGTRAVVAALGTAFTEDQIVRMWRLAPEPVICFDGDKAGIRAAHRAIDRILPQLKSGFSFNFCVLPDGKDPDELIALGGREAFMAEIARATPLADMLWERETATAPIDTPERKAALEKRFEDLVAEIKDQRVARGYRLSLRLKLSNLFYETERRARDANRPPRPQPGSNARANPRGNPRGHAETGASTPPLPEGDLIGVERIVLGLCLEYPDLFEAHVERLVTVPFAHPVHERFKSELYRLATELDGQSVSTLFTRVDPRFYFVLKELHGEDPEDGSARLSKLKERLPILRFRPPPAFIEDCFTHLIDRLELRAMERELDEEIARVDADCDRDTEARILSLSRDITLRRELFARAEQDLAEEAKAIRAAFGVDGARNV
jgi:DNA primase